MGDNMSAREPIYVPCEGSNMPAAGHQFDGPFENSIASALKEPICAMCGRPMGYYSKPGNTKQLFLLPHPRQDIIAMINRGDFDA